MRVIVIIKSIIISPVLIIYNSEFKNESHCHIQIHNYFPSFQSVNHFFIDWSLKPDNAIKFNQPGSLSSPQKTNTWSTTKARQCHKGYQPGFLSSR